MGSNLQVPYHCGRLAVLQGVPHLRQTSVCQVLLEVAGVDVTASVVVAGTAGWGIMLCIVLIAASLLGNVWVWVDEGWCTLGLESRLVAEG
jgi:hypothetical protein